MEKLPALVIFALIGCVHICDCKKRACPVGPEPSTEESMYLIPELRNFQNLTDKSIQRTMRMDVNDGGCPHQNRTEQHCPHFYVISYNRNRIPTVLYHARCACRTCTLGQCQEVMYYRYVLERNSRNNCYKWKLREYPIACRCVRVAMAKNKITPTQNQ
ncbi:uncharacterized protein [Haliotis cracherodii]|uniref:uncharacterized protein n=1 Tax=Haliotis cracherodii TaxID=6455 RepID=UPI0039E81CD9